MSEVPIWVSPNGTWYALGGPEANCTLAACPIETSVYGYRPSLPFSSTLIALFGLCMIVQIYLGCRWRNWGFMAAMVLGCIDEILGYVGRIMYYNDPWGRVGFIMQIVLITLGPVFFSAAIYVLIYQIAVYISPGASRFPPVFFYYIFIPCDIISLILQATGGAMSSTSFGKSTTGVNIALAGLIFQVITLFFFVVCVVDYMIRSRPVWRTIKLSLRFKNFWFWLALATILIFTRCCYRVYELNEGYSRESEALRDEVLFNALEGGMIIAAAWCLVGAHPGFVFKPNQATPASMVAENGIVFGEAKGKVGEDSSPGNSMRERQYGA